MTENTMMQDLLAAQREMPALQKSAINPHFKNRFVPLDELIPAVLPILNKHNFVLMQMPAFHEGQPCLDYELRHVSGEMVGGSMALLCGKDDPQGQGSAITYARRYSLMALLGLTADADDDAEATRTAPKPPTFTFAHAVRQGVAGARVVSRTPAPQRASNGPSRDPSCPDCGGPMWNNIAKKESGQFKPNAPDMSCKDKECGGKIWSLHELSEEETGVDPDDIPFSE